MNYEGNGKYTNSKVTCPHSYFGIRFSSTRKETSQIECKMEEGYENLKHKIGEV